MNALLTIERGHVLSPVAHELIAALGAELSAMYPEEVGTVFRFEEGDVAAGRGAFLIAHSGSEPVGCGAVRAVGGGVGEIKRMYVRPSARGQGVARAVLAALEAEARGLALRRLILETGVRQGPALALYRHAGYSDIPPYGEFVGNPLSACLAKDLTP